jgi:MFS family permease
MGAERIHKTRTLWLWFLAAATLMAVFPYLTGLWMVPGLAAYGFFFMSSYPMVEAALMQSVPDAVRGRVFGLFITVGGLISNLSHWIAGDQVKRMGDAAYAVSSYCPLYGAIAAMALLSLAGLPCLHAIRKREHLDPAPALPVELPMADGQRPIVNHKS